MKLSSGLIVFTVLLSASAIGNAATPKPGAATGMPQSPDECKKTVGTPGANGYMPRGATDENLKEYQESYRCEASAGRPIDAETCKKTMQKLYDVALEINQLVVRNCDEIIPKFTKDPEVMACIHSQGLNKDQSGCTKSALSTLSSVNPIIREFKAKLKNFHKVLNEVQAQGYQVSEKVVGVIDEGYKAKGTPRLTQPSSSAAQLGLSTLEETNLFNGNQDPKIAQALLADFQSRFQDSQSTYKDVNAANYQQKFQPIEEGWQKLNTVQSKILREHMHSYLNAEELKLATTLYENQLQEVDAQVAKQTAINNETIARLGPVAPQLAAPLMAANANSGLTGADSGIGMPISNSAKLSSSKIGSNKGPSVASESSGLDGVAIDKINGAMAEKGGNSSGSSTLTAGAAAREALRKKLMGNGMSGAEVSNSGSSVLGSDGSSQPGGKEGAHGASSKGDDPILAGRNSERLLASFSGQNLLDTGFQMDGPTTDGAVQAIVDGFNNALNEHELENAGIGSEDDVSLFLRVREFHDKCLKSGCVTGLAKK